MSSDDDANRREFDLMMARHAIVVPPALIEAALPIFAEMASAARMVRAPRDMTAPPAYVFSLDAIVRGPREPT